MVHDLTEPALGGVRTSGVLTALHLETVNSHLRLFQALFDFTQEIRVEFCDFQIDIFGLIDDMDQFIDQFPLNAFDILIGAFYNRHGIPLLMGIPKEKGLSRSTIYKHKSDNDLYGCFDKMA